VKVVLEMKRVCKPGGALVFLNHFRSENRLLGAIERMVSPLCYRIGFRTDLDLRSLMRDCGLQADLCEEVGFLGNWKAVRCLVE
jgi:phosphatidylethanolamine/phosphatidyl-N-methylethanolamine N-methyltransferase